MEKYKELIINIIFICSESLAIILTCNLLHKFQFEYYTLDSNLFAFIIGCIYVLYLNRKKKIPRWLQITRMMTLMSLMLTFLVTLFILLPTYNFNFKFLFLGPNFFLHLFCPLLLLYIYIFLDKKKKLSNKELLICVIPTIIYAIILITLNILRIVKGPYKFLDVHNQSVIASVLWFILLLLFIYLIGFTINKISHKKSN